MKKKIAFFILVFVCSLIFAQKQIGTITKDNILFVTAINEKPVYAYYEFKESTGKQIYISYNDTIFGPYDYIFDKYDFNEKRIMLMLGKGDYTYFFINGHEYEPYAFAYLDRFISDTEYLYHAAKEETDIEDPIIDTDVYINGTHYPDVKNIVRNKKGDEARVIFDKSTEQYYVEYNKKKSGPYESRISNIDFLSDGKTLVFKAQKEYQEEYKDYLIINGKETGPFDRISDLQFSLDKKHYAYFFEKDYQYTLVKDGQIVGTYDDIDAFSDSTLLRFVRNTDKLCFYEYNSEDNTCVLHFDKQTYLDVVPHWACFSNNSVMYLKSDDYIVYDAYIDGEKIQENIIKIYPSSDDLNNYAYLAEKKIPASEVKDSYYGAFDENNKDIFNAECLFYKNNEYILNGFLEYVCILNDRDLLYLISDRDSNYYFYLNGNRVYEIPPLEDPYNDYSDIYIQSIYTGEDFFSVNYGESKVYLNGTFYTGTANDKQIVYVDNGIIYLKKH